jgi:hypothetical protein
MPKKGIQNKLKLLFTVNVAFILLGFPHAVSAKLYPNPVSFPFQPKSRFYLTGTPKTHYPSNTRAAVDIQVVDEFGMVDKGAHLYSPVNGYAQIIESPNGSKTIEIVDSTNTWKIIMSHIMDDTKGAQRLNNTYPKHVVIGEHIAFQGDSGYVNEGKFPVHIHYEIYKKINGQWDNDNSIIDLCSQLNIVKYCNYADDLGRIIFVSEL